MLIWDVSSRSCIVLGLRLIAILSRSLDSRFHLFVQLIRVVFLLQTSHVLQPLRCSESGLSPNLSILVLTFVLCRFLLHSCSTVPSHHPNLSTSSPLRQPTLKLCPSSPTPNPIIQHLIHLPVNLRDQFSTSHLANSLRIPTLRRSISTSDDIPRSTLFKASIGRFVFFNFMERCTRAGHILRMDTSSTPLWRKQCVPSFPSSLSRSSLADLCFVSSQVAKAQLLILQVRLLLTSKV